MTEISTEAVTKFRTFLEQAYSLTPETFPGYGGWACGPFEKFILEARTQVLQPLRDRLHRITPTLEHLRLGPAKTGRQPLPFNAPGSLVGTGFSTGPTVG